MSDDKNKVDPVEPWGAAPPSSRRLRTPIREDTSHEERIPLPSWCVGYSCPSKTEVAVKFGKLFLRGLLGGGVSVALGVFLFNALHSLILACLVVGLLSGLFKVIVAHIKKT